VAVGADAEAAVEPGNMTAKDRGDPPTSFETLIANWATDRGIPLSEAVIRLEGTPMWVKAKLCFAVHGADAEPEIRRFLDAALAAGL